MARPKRQFSDMIERFVHYDIDTKTRHIIENNKVIDVKVFKRCPYVWAEEIENKVKAGLIKWIGFKQWRHKDMPLPQ